MANRMLLRVWDVQHGACTMLHHSVNNVAQRIAMIDSGDTPDWTPSSFIRNVLHRNRLDYLFITNADQDHMSGLQGLWDAGIHVPVVHRNPDPSAFVLRAIKEQCGTLTRDAERYLDIHSSYNALISHPFNDHMGGITATMYWNTWPRFSDTNNLSLAIFIQYRGFKILFPGDLEAAGWEAILEQAAFRVDLTGINVLVASHHGRESGYCPDVFDYCKPQAIVMSDKDIAHDTQRMTQTYRNHILRHHPNGVVVNTTGKNRRVLTTRRDGWIHFEVFENGSFNITTEKWA